MVQLILQFRHVYLEFTCRDWYFRLFPDIVVEPEESPFHLWVGQFYEMSCHRHTPYTCGVLYLEMYGMIRMRQPRQIGINVPVVGSHCTSSLVFIVGIKPIAVVIRCLSPCCPFQAQQQGK